MTYRLIISSVTWCHCSCTLISFTELSCHACNSHCSILIAGYMDSRLMATAAFVKENDSLFDSFNGVAHNPNHKKVLRCRLSSTRKHLEHWQNAASMIKSWTFLNKECEPIRTPPSQTGWLTTIAAVQCVEKGE